MSTPKTLDDNALYLAGEVGKAVRDSIIKIIREQGYDISPEQFGILVRLWYQDGISQSDLIDKVGRDKTTISRILARMIKSKLIARATDPDNKRINRISITQKGRAIQEILIQKSGAIYIKALGGISQDELNTVNNILRKIYTNITE